jgi:hypothetical protein
MTKKNLVREFKVPYDPDGNLMHHPHAWNYTPEWRDRKPFKAALTYVGYERGRSAAWFKWQSPEGHQFPMFMKDVDTLFRNLPFDGDCVWIECKRGQNYGVRLATAEEIAHYG